MSRRTERVNDQVREEIGDLLLRGLRDPVLSVTLISVTEVDVSPDLHYATVYVSTPMAVDQADLVARLNRAAPFLHRELRKRLHTMRRVPELRFAWDVSMERGARLTALIRESAAALPDDDGPQEP
jgi:ribosome-binding factor A